MFKPIAASSLPIVQTYPTLETPETLLCTLPAASCALEPRSPSLILPTQLPSKTCHTGLYYFGTCGITLAMCLGATPGLAGSVVCADETHTRD
mmetsp:Transcript_3019/g.5302  ORF Transcript_3019/g.5302 Transcript_3019/m.5302 type:complete len:93 (+) Transcript_3019:299-577(+)